MIKFRPADSNSYLAVITPSLLCNYDCSYCRIKSKTRANDEHDLTEWLEALKLIGSPIAHVAGGEPTVLPGFEDFVLAYPGLLRMTTNLSRDPSRYDTKFWCKFDYLTLSFHPEFTSFEKFLESAKFIHENFGVASNGPRMACTIVAHPKFLNVISGWINALKAVGVEARGQYFNAPANSNLKTYSEEELILLKEIGIPMSTLTPGQQEIDTPTLKSCNAGMYYTHINRRGDARRCSRDNLSLGNIFDGTFAWFPKEKQCSTLCTEACDHTFAKFSIVKRIKNMRNSDNKSMFAELLDEELSDNPRRGWSGNGVSNLRLSNGELIVERNNGPSEQQCTRIIKVSPNKIYEFRSEKLSSSHGCVIQVNGEQLWSGKRGRVKFVFKSAGEDCTIEILPAEGALSKVSVTKPSVSLSIPNSN